MLRHMGDAKAAVHGVAKKRALSWWFSGKNLPAKQKMWVQSLDWDDSLEKEMPTHSYSCFGNPSVLGATTGDPTHDKVMWKRAVKQGFRTQGAP